MREFGAATRAWFEASFEAPTPVQREGWPHIARGEHALLIAPTGSGKTLAAFLWCIDRLVRTPEGEPGVRVVYVSPLKALVHDIERNLRAPLAGIHRAAQGRGEALRLPRVAMRTGDTSQRERRLQARDPAEILVTTPESLYLILGSAQRETLRTVHTVIVDEIHALAPTKRGAHLALSLERLALSTGRDPQRIGCSATARPLAEVARFLGGDRPVRIVDTSTRPLVDLGIVVPVADMEKPTPARPAESAGTAQAPPPPAAGDSGSILSELATGDTLEPQAGLWPFIYPRLLEQIRAHRSSIVFVNSRGLCERLCRRLNELAGEELVRAHHGSIAHAQRKEIEEALKQGSIRGIVATSSLELGIDMGAVDLVLLVESPGAVARGLQRVGRAGHQVDAVSRARVFPKHRGDLLEAAVVVHAMERGEVEPIRLPRNPLDVLAQHIVAQCGSGETTVEVLESLLRRTASFRELSREALVGVLDMLAGRYPSTDFAELRPRIVWDRENDVLSARRGARQLALTSGGTIPDRGQYAVHLGPEGPRIGELDEEMVHETRAGQTLTLGASTWRVEQITRDRVVVVPAPGEIGRLPFWRGEGPGRPLELGRAIGAFVRELASRSEAEAQDWLRKDYHLDAWAARNLVAYLREQREATGTLPTDRAVTIERFRDELGDWRVCIHSPFGARIHAPWALAIEGLLSRAAGFEMQTLWNDDGIVLRLADADRTPDAELLLPEPEDVEDLVVEQLAHSALFASQFRENAARALLLPRRRPGTRTPLWSQRLRAQNLLAVAREFPSFPIMLETYRACLQDVFDVPGLVELLGSIRRREIRVEEAETVSPSPFARSLVFAYTAAYLYQGDVPIAERRAQALTLDRHMLRDLLGQEDLRQLLDAVVVDETEAELQCLAEGYQARHADGLHDVLRRVGDLDDAELAARCEGAPGPWLEELVRSGRALRVRVAGAGRWIAAEDVALYRDALGVVPPSGLPEALLTPVVQPLEQLLARFARTRGPFETRLPARRYDLLPAQLEPVLAGMEAQGRVQRGEFHPAGLGPEWCDPEVLRRMRRRTLARLRGEVAPVEASVLARFLPRWHGIATVPSRETVESRGERSGSAERRLREALGQLEGVPLAFNELERVILPARVPGFDPRMLDERGALGELVWVGCGPLGERDGRIALYHRARIGLLLDVPSQESAGGRLEGAILAHLGERGACFFAELLQAVGHCGQDDLLEALRDLAWSGLLTNDTFAPLRALSARRRGRGRNAPALPTAAAGRWSLVRNLIDASITPTERAHARALLLLERYGVVSRDVMALEATPGGFAAVYPVFKAMEESGKLRRGHFVDGLSGAQFAFAGAVDRLRAERRLGGDPLVTVLAATDPANPFGALLPWPTPRVENAGTPRRAAGATLVSVDGEPVLYLERGGRRALSFPAANDAGLAAHAAAALRRLVAGGRRRSLRIEWVDGEPASQAGALTQALRDAGFRPDYKGFVLERTAL